MKKKDYIFDMYSTRTTYMKFRYRDFYVENYEAVRNKTYLDEVWVEEH